MTHQPGTLADVDEIAAAVVAAFVRGARTVPVAAAAVEALRGQLLPQMSSALRSPEWDEQWQRERVYVVAYARALGQRAKVLAVDDRRATILPHDVEAAFTRMRGYMPIAGRWCPV